MKRKLITLVAAVAVSFTAFAKDGDIPATIEMKDGKTINTTAVEFEKKCIATYKIDPNKRKRAEVSGADVKRIEVKDPLGAAFYVPVKTVKHRDAKKKSYSDVQPERWLVERMVHYDFTLYESFAKFPNANPQEIAPGQSFVSYEGVGEPVRQFFVKPKGKDYAVGVTTMSPEFEAVLDLDVMLDLISDAPELVKELKAMKSIPTDNQYTMSFGRTVKGNSKTEKISERSFSQIVYIILRYHQYKEEKE